MSAETQSAFATDRGGDRGHPRRARWSSSATTRTARTRATSRSPRSSRRPRRSTSWRKEGRGLICLALTPDRCDELGLDLMAAKNESPFETAFTVSIEAREGVTTGISAHDRAHTIQVAIDPALAPARPRPAGARLPAEGASAGGVLGARRPDRGRGRPRAARGPEPGRRDLRDHERRRDDGARRRPRRLLRAARAEDDHRRRPDRLPAPPRQARRARGRDRPADRLRRLRRRRLPLARRRQAPRRDGQGRRRRAPRTCSCACTPSASPATSSTRCAATAASSSSRRSR